MDYLPGWNSIETTAWLHGFFEKSSLVLGVVLAIAIVLAYLYGHRRDHLSDEAMHATAAARHLALDETNGGMVARPGPGPEIQSTPVTGRPAIGEKSFSDDEARTPVRTTPFPAAENTPSSAQEKQRPPEFRETRSPRPPAPPKERPTDVKGTAGIDMHKSAEPGGPHTPRHLSPDQRARLHAFLKNQPKGRLVVRINPSVPDASNYGVELARFFRHETGWPVRIDNSPFKGADLGGLWLALRSADAIPPATGTLHAALAHAHVPVRPQPVWDPGGPAFNEIWLVIGKRH